MKHFKFLVSPAFMGAMFIAFALAMAIATFIENDFGAEAAYNTVYNTKWFELILLLLAVNLTGQLIIFNLFRRSRLPGALFHLAFIVMLAGAAITRYFGWEGSIHIREGAEQNIVMSDEKYLSYNVRNSEGTTLQNESEIYLMSSAARGRYNKTFSINGSEYRLKLEKVLPNADIAVMDKPGGEPVITLFVMSSDMSGESMILKKGETKTYKGVSIGFETDQVSELNIKSDSGAFYASSSYDLSEMSMMTRQILPVEKGKPLRLKERQVLVLRDIRIVPQSMSESAVIEPVAVSTAERITGQNAFVFKLGNGGKDENIYLWDRGDSPATASASANGNIFEVSYGPEMKKLPFTIKLNDFILERYPGSNSPSGYKSDVILIDKSESVEQPFMIFMNNILKYKGYRFYQSSYDKDEKGTILSVNHDPVGMLVTYTGYALLFLFIIMSILNRNSVFFKVNAGYWNSRLRKAAVVLALILFSGTGIKAQKFVPGKEVSEEFGKLLVQDQKGRTKPLFTLSNDILRKVVKENKYEGMTSMQVFLGVYLDFDNWKDVPLISVSNKEVRERLNISGNRAAFSDIVDLGSSGAYKISSDVDNAYNKAPGKRTRFDKEIMKIDERVNIIYMIYNGNFLKAFPLKDGTHDWGSFDAALKKAVTGEDSTYLQGILPVLTKALQANDVSAVVKVRESIGSYQERFSEYELPSESKTGAELIYYRLNIFEKLFPFYATLGMVMLILLIMMVIRGGKGSPVFIDVAKGLLFAGFIFHTLGLALRWYIAGHSPMSNGYESMLFISWVTLLAGFIFMRRSPFALPATAVLASMTLLVAHMSFMDPEITNLVPVLKSYWLTLHVSVITGSYGFLGLGAILGLITLILLILAGKENKERISKTIDELTVLNYKTLTLGLYFLTIGTFLGAVWANESWGRYWGWDPKETWSLITIVIYSLVIHSRIIPGMKDIFTFNLISLIAFSSVLMTYFGVNYYLSGLHSYAAGDPVPVPSFVYIAVIAVAGVAVLAYRKYQRM